MKRFLIPIIVFLSAPIYPIKAVEINCNSPVYKNKPQCAHLKNKKTFIYENIEYDSKALIPIEDVEKREEYVYKKKTFIASKICPEGTNMIWFYTKRRFRSTKVEEKGCLTPDKARIFELETIISNMRRGGGGGAGGVNMMNQYSNSYNRQMDTYRQIDNFHNTGSFTQPNFGF
tara:strand:- start:613 stop:1134 length:522 start_codon:yes stop_codon:yes gene_type:complete